MKKEDQDQEFEEEVKNLDEYLCREEFVKGKKESVESKCEERETKARAREKNDSRASDGGSDGSDSRRLWSTVHDRFSFFNGFLPSSSSSRGLF